MIGHPYKRYVRYSWGFIISPGITEDDAAQPPSHAQLDYHCQKVRTMVGQPLGVRILHAPMSAGYFYIGLAGKVRIGAGTWAGSMSLDLQPLPDDAEKLQEFLFEVTP